ncbi:MAG: rhodanese-like domain-containing protein [Phycisphaerales bacterium]
MTETAPASPDETAAHHAERFRFSTDCWDVHHALQSADPGFVLVDVRPSEHFRAGHIAGSINLPVASLDEARLKSFEAGTLFVVLCAGPHCNGASRAALRLARLGRPVKEMLGGITGWIDEGHSLVTT